MHEGHRRPIGDARAYRFKATKPFTFAMATLSSKLSCNVGPSLPPPPPCLYICTQSTRSLEDLSFTPPQIRITGDALQVAEFSKRLVAAVLAYFPDNAESFKSVSKATVLAIISQVGFFLQENYPMQALHTSLIHEPGTDYEEFDIHDPISRYNLGEVKFADFRLEMAVRLMKTARLDLRLAGLIELKEVLVRIQNLQQGRSRPRRRSDIDMEVQMELDKKPIE